MKTSLLFLAYLFISKQLVANETCPVSGNLRQGLVEMVSQGQPHRWQIEVAETPEQRAYGLMHRDRLPGGCGMLFLWEHDNQTPFWMKDTAVALDIIFMDGEGEVLEIFSHTQPFSEKLIEPRRAYRLALEVVAGTAQKYHIKPGSHLRWLPQ